MFLKDRLHIATKRTYTDEGFLSVPANISRVGIQNYTAAEMGLTDRDPTDIVRVYRPADEVFTDASLSSFSLLGRSFTTEENWSLPLWMAERIFASGRALRT